MRLTSTRIEKTPQLMIIPMIDIIFFLLVFFMLSTLYMVNQETIPVNLPKAVTASTDTEKALQVTIGKDGGLYLGKEAMELQDIKKNVTSAAMEGNISLVLRADGDVDYSKFIAVLDELKKTGVHKISLAAKQGD